MVLDLAAQGLVAVIVQDHPETEDLVVQTVLPKIADSPTKLHLVTPDFLTKIVHQATALLAAAKDLATVIVHLEIADQQVVEKEDLLAATATEDHLKAQDPAAESADPALTVAALTKPVDQENLSRFFLLINERKKPPSKEILREVFLFWEL